MNKLLYLSLILFFTINLSFITYIVDLEQIVIPVEQAQDPSKLQYPLWPPKPLVDLVHWYGRSFDPVLIARPPWWRATIWIDSLFFGPFYAVALFAFVFKKNWIRIPSIVWGSVLMTNVTVILFEEFLGPHATPYPLFVLGLNLPWLVFPAVTILTMAAGEPFPRADREDAEKEE